MLAVHLLTDVMQSPKINRHSSTFLAGIYINGCPTKVPSFESRNERNLKAGHTGMTTLLY
jgi:hypothetical protein